ncbi:aminodeoxychorismate lyase [Aspergillus udagawae]|uniref:Aminodeoxychorismate lyase n=1 Tax=Aspergillus udagawae TaxID=91492 RepID=A0A8H3NGH6_9EURO|nr:aminodeoxychorismate lyase [Aspergillus udagawae]
MATISPSQDSESFQIISSLRYEPALPELLRAQPSDAYPDSLRSPYYLLPYHQERLLRAAECFGWSKAAMFLQQDVESFVEHLNSFIPDRTKPWRLRIVIDKDGACTVEVNAALPMDPLSLLLPSEMNQTSTPWLVTVDSQRTVPSPFTTHKTTSRDNYTAARLRAKIASPQDPAEVLIVNPHGEIMEGSITTPYFRRRRSASPQVKIDQEDAGPAWVTPPLSSGGNAGTTRRYALARGFCSEQAITVAELIDGEECWLSNGVRGFFQGKILLKEPKS